MPHIADGPYRGQLHGTTILCVRKTDRVVIAGDGQVTFGQTILKQNARKVRPLANGTILSGFAGSTADAFALFERLEQKLERFPAQLSRACVELGKDWRTDRYLRRLEAMLIVADHRETFVLTGSGDVLEPEHPVIAVGSGAGYAIAAARALYDFVDDAETIARRAILLAADIDLYTNANIVVESLASDPAR